MTPNEVLYGVIWAPCLRGPTGPGYALAITSERVVATKKMPIFKGGFLGYLGPESQLSDEMKANGKDIADQIIAGTLGDRGFELSKDSIAQIILKDPGWSSGCVVFKSTDATKGDIQMDILNPPGDGTALVATPKLKRTLLVFAADRLYNGKTGACIIDEWRQKRAQKQAKKHWW